MFTQFIYMERNTKVWKPEQDANPGLPLAQLAHPSGWSECRTQGVGGELGRDSTWTGLGDDGQLLCVCGGGPPGLWAQPWQPRLMPRQVHLRGC